MPRSLKAPLDSRERPPERRSRTGNTKRKTKKQKTRRSGNLAKNGLLIAVFGVVLALLVIFLPKEPTRPSATLLSPGVSAGSGDGSALDGNLAIVETPSIRISEVMASNKSAYPDDKGNYSDWIEIENTSNAAVNLEGIGLSDRDDRILFIFPEITLEGGERIIVFCDDTHAADKDKPLHARFKISALGETLTLFGTDGVPFDSVAVPPINSDFSYALTDSGWLSTEQYTPGYPNTDAGFEAFHAEAVVSAEGLMLNEMCASNRTSMQDEDGEYSDWIELYNGGSLPIDLSNYALSDDETNLTKWRFPQGAIIRPGEYYLVFASGKDRTGDGATHPHTNFKLAAEGETVILSDILRQVIDRTAYDNLSQDTSWGRVDGVSDEWRVFQQPTPGLPNNRTGEIEMDARLRANNTSGIFISEVLTSSSGMDTPYNRTSYDWIEIVNRSINDIDISGWGLSDKLSRPRKWQIPEGTLLKAGEYLMIFASGLGKSPTNSGALHSTYRLSALGETIVLSDAQGKIHDKLVVPKLELNNSFGRDFDQGGLFYYETPTPQAKNNMMGFAGYATKPTISMAGGVFTKPVSVTITAPEGTRIRYTTDGSNPTEVNGRDFTGEPVEITDTTAFRARGFVEGLKPSDIATETYLINIYPSLPVISLTLDPDELYNVETGMFAEDEDLKATYTRVPFDGLTYWKKLPHTGNFEYFTADGKQILNQGVELQLNGQYSMDQAQKSIRITARARYGKSTLAYPFFSDRPYKEYQAVILRNGGQDGKYTRIIDALQSKIIDWTGSDILHMASTPVLCYINGEYWGHYNLRERINKYSIAAFEGWTDPENIDFIKGEDNVISGSFTNYGELLKYCKETDLNDPAALQKVLDWVDVDNYFDFMIFQIYFGNTDAGNIKFYRRNAPGEKWRWVVFDLDWGYFNSNIDGCNAWLKPEGAGDRKFDNTIIRALLKVPSMRDKFLTRYGQLFQDVLSDTDRIRTEADAMLAVIAPELVMHFNRWAGTNSPLVSEEPTTPEGLQKYWTDRVSRMHNVLKKRPNLAWGHVQNFFDLSNEDMLKYFGPQPEMPADAL